MGVRRAFAVAGPTAWNSLSDDLRDPMLSTDNFRRLLKTQLFSEYQYIQHIRGIDHTLCMHYLNSRLLRPCICDTCVQLFARLLGQVVNNDLNPIVNIMLFASSCQSIPEPFH